jgi:hypothetical protein
MKARMRIWPKQGPNSVLIIALGLYVVACALTMLFSLRATDWKLIYPLDDTYIGMAISKNFAEYGVWGVTRYQFSSASSSPLFTLLLSAVYFLTGPTEWWPFVLAFTFGAGAIIVADRILQDYLSEGRRLVALSLLVLLTPLAVMAQTGMEHTLHIFLALLFLDRASRAIADHSRMDYLLLVYAALMTMARYEGLFLVGSCALFLAIRRAWILSGAVMLSALVPVCAYGLISISHGWKFLPNSLLLKGTGVTSFSLQALLKPLYHMAGLMSRGPHMATLVLALIVMLVLTRTKDQWPRPRLMIWLTLLASLAHLAFADIGWVFRYESYLVAMAIVSLAATTRWFPQKSWLRIGLALLILEMLVPLTARAVTSASLMPSIARTIYVQQYQTAIFLKRYYSGASVAANDIGAINYQADLKCLDLVGLANKTVFYNKQAHTYETPIIESEAVRMSTQIAVVYDEWFVHGPRPVLYGPPLPTSWIRVGRMRIKADKLFLGGDTVSFYAVKPEAKDRLVKVLHEFLPALPKDVEWLEN